MGQAPLPVGCDGYDGGMPLPGKDRKHEDHDSQDRAARRVGIGRLRQGEAVQRRSDGGITSGRANGFAYLAPRWAIRTSTSSTAGLVRKHHLTVGEANLGPERASQCHMSP